MRSLFLAMVLVAAGCDSGEVSGPSSASSTTGGSGGSTSSTSSSGSTGTGSTGSTSGGSGSSTGGVDAGPDCGFITGNCCARNACPVSGVCLPSSQLCAVCGGFRQGACKASERGYACEAGLYSCGGYCVDTRCP